MGYCKKDITPVLTHWSYIFLALTQHLMLSAQCNTCACHESIAVCVLSAQLQEYRTGTNPTLIWFKHIYLKHNQGAVNINYDTPLVTLI